MKKFLLYILFVFVSFDLSAQCQGIDFTASSTSACRNELIRFYASGVPAGSQVKWFVNNQEEPGTDTFYYFFNQAGSYDIRLQVTLASQQVCTVDKPGFVTITAPQVDSLVSSKKILCDLNEQVTLRGYGKNIAQWNWILENNYFPDAGEVITYTFKSEGVKQGKVVVLDSNGCLAQYTEDTLAHVAAVLSVDFTDSNSTGCQPLHVFFKPQVSVNKNLSIDYLWSFPGGIPSSSTLANPDTVVYSVPGEYPVTLTVSLANGCTKTVVKNDLVRVGDTVNLQIISDKKDICKKDVVKFWLKDTVASPLSLTWNFPGGYVLPQSTLDTHWVEYTASGKYDVSVSYNYNGCTDSELDTSYIDVLELKAGFFIYNPYNCTPPHSVSFQNTSSLPKTGTVRYEWTFLDKDGQSVYARNNLPSPYITYNDWGRYHVRLKLIQSPRGCVDSIQVNNAVIVQPFRAELNNMGDIRACVNQPALFSVPSSMLGYSLYPIDVKWTFFDKDNVTIKDTKSGKSTTEVYDTGGFYSFSVVADNGHGCYDSVYFDKKVEIIDIHTDFQVDTQYICTGNTVRVDVTSKPTGNYANSWKTYNRSFAQGNKYGVTGQNVIDIPFDYPGIYGVELTSQKSTCQDVFLRDSLIYVSGIYSSIDAAKSVVCPGDSVLVSALITLNKNYTSLPDTLIYFWEVKPENQAVISHPYDSQTYIQFLSPGCYTINLTVQNGAGCSYSTSVKDAVCAGTVASFQFPSAICPEKNYTVQNKSLRATSYQWYASDTAVHFIPSATATQPQIFVTHPGNYWISMKSLRPGCSDSASVSFRTEFVSADFFTPDTLNYCAPVQVNFFALPSDAINYIWDFDGININTRDTQISYFYLQNAGSPDTGYTVKLIAVSSAGCTDTVTKSEYVKVVGPAPLFDVINPAGCNPLRVSFIDKSRNVGSYLFQFDDGYFVENGNFSSHTYDISTYNSDSMIFIPRLFAFDTAGCNFVYEGDSIIVYQYARAAFSADENIGCEPFEVHLVDLSQYHDLTVWDFESDSIWDDTGSFVTHIYPAGNYSVTLWAQNRHGCHDTLVKSLYIESYPRLKTSIKAADTVICLVEDGVFYPEIIFSKKKIKSYFWKFYDAGSNPDTLSGPNARFRYTNSGFHDIMLVVKDEYNCTDTFFRKNFIYVSDTVSPARVEIKYVTVQSNSELEIHWEKYSSPDFESYQLYSDDGSGYKLKAGIFPADSTWFVDAAGVNPQSNIYNYKMAVQNACQLESSYSVPHHNILLTGWSDRHGQIDLQWNSYTGWNKVVSYKVMKKNPADSQYYVAAVLSPLDTHWVDKDLCNDSYCYFIIATSPDSDIQSVSNTICLQPLYQLPSATFAKRTTIISNKIPLTEWHDYNQARNKLYYIDRNTGNSGWIDDYAITTDTFFYDSLANIYSDYYAYRIRSLDSCGNLDDIPTQPTNTILLKIEKNEANQIILSWNPYPEIIPGGLTYLLEKQDEDSTFKVITSLPSGTTRYIDNNIYPDENRPFCYRIRASFGTDSSYESVSNIACMLFPSRIYLPTAFSPNNDGINDYFSIYSTSLFEKTGNENVDFILTVFNQWGEILFQTTNPREKWDGTFKGKTVPEGVYYYSVFARGMDYSTYKLSGTIQIIR